ncbi:MAG: hypothetical protein HQ554_05175 [FCB group bacterium]|nr:hypothetical protein [FCB group bacterium]
MNIPKEEEKKIRETIDELLPIKELKIPTYAISQPEYNLRHIVNGKWVHLVKTIDNKFYTNGKLEKDYSHVI